MELRDLDLVARVLAGDDRHVFSELVRRHQSGVRAFLRRLTRGQDALADDLAQETFIAAYRGLQKFRGGAAFSTWLLGIAYNCLRQHLRRTRPTEPWEGDTSLARATSEVASATVTDPARDIALQHDLAAALARLSDDERAAIHLCFDGGLSHAEAAAALGCPLGTLKSHVNRAKEELRTALHAWAPTWNLFHPHSSVMYHHPPSPPRSPPPPDRLSRPRPGDGGGDDDAWIGAFLRQNRDADYIDDAGFTARVVRALPRHAQRRGWIVAGAVFVGAALALTFAWTRPLVWCPATTIGHLSSLSSEQPLALSYALIGISLLLAAGVAWKAILRHR